MIELHVRDGNDATSLHAVRLLWPNTWTSIVKSSTGF